MAESEVAIANRALQLLGESSISSLEQDHPNARSMNLAYPFMRNRLQRAYAWNFCKARKSVAADAVQTTFGGLNRFEKPNDFLRLLRNKETSAEDSRHDWQIEGNYIVTADSAPLEFRYLAKVTNPVLFDTVFDDLLAVGIAYTTCKQVTGSNTAKSELRDEFRELMAEARQTNSFENDADVPLEDDWVLARL
jgi:hypothetical protein